jgi:hypothetical protein
MIETNPSWHEARGNGSRASTGGGPGLPRAIGGRHNDGHGSLGRYDGVLFHLVIMRAARLQAQAWKSALEEYLARRARERGQVHEPFDLDADFRRYLEGRPRDETSCLRP